MSTPIDPHDPAVRILIVEDESFAESLAFYLESKFPSATVRVAKTITQAAALIKDEPPFDFAVLDYHIPFDEGHNPSREPGLKGMLKKSNPAVQTIRVTAYDKDDALKLTGELTPDDGYLENAFLSKEDDPSSKVGGWILQAYHTRRIRMKMTSLLQGAAIPQSGPSPLRPRTSAQRNTINDRERSLDFAMFFLDAGQYWEFLAPRLQQDLDNAFGHVVMEDGGHLVGVVKDNSLQTKTHN